MPIALYHPNLEPPHNTCVVMDENQVEIMAESGWKRAPEPEQVSPAHVPEPVTYAPVEPKKAAAAKKAIAKESVD